jgi:hypothetical protein
VGAALAIAVEALGGPMLSPTLRLILGMTVLFTAYIWMLLHVMGQKVLYVDLLQGLRIRTSVESPATIPV